MPAQRLCQEQGGKLRVIGYASRRLGKSEENHPWSLNSCVWNGQSQKNYMTIYMGKIQSEDCQQPLNVHINNSQARRYGKEMGFSIVSIWFWDFIQTRKKERGCRCLDKVPTCWKKHIHLKEIQAVYGNIQVSNHIINMAETTEQGQPLA